MRAITFLFLSLLSSVTYAGCDQIAEIRTETLYIDIGTGGCDTSVNMISYGSKERLDDWYADIKKVPFSSECTLTKDGFKCRANGVTPLAGATYKKIMFGRSQHDNSCGDGEPNYEGPGEKYICVKGCGKLTVPEFLYGNDGSC